MAQLIDLLGWADIVTIVGPGGVGKTTLAAEVAREWQRRDESPISFVALDAGRAPEDVGRALAAALRIDVPAGADIVDAAIDLLATQSSILVVDNCEHLLGAASDLVDRIVRAAPGTIVLATSREPLGLGTENVFRLDPLSVEAHDGEPAAASELFAAMAARSIRDFRIDDGTAPAVNEICRSLDGLPLGIELAVGRLATLGLDGLADQVSVHHDPGRSRRRDLDDRHRSLTDLVDWSFELLGGPAQRLHVALCAFPAGLDVAAISVLGTRVGLTERIDDVLSELVDCSMVRRVDTDSGPRIVLLDTLRAHGLPLLQASDDRIGVREALVQHADDVSRAERNRVEGRAPQARWYAHVRRELANLRAARIVLEERGDVARLVDLSLSLLVFTEEACLAEPWEWHVGLLDAAVASGCTDDVVEGAQLLSAASARNEGRYEEATQQAGELTDAIDPWVRTMAHHELAMTSLFTGDPIAAAEHWQAGAEASDWWCRGRVLAGLGRAYAGDLDGARAALAECRDRSLQPDAPAETRSNHLYVLGEIERLDHSGLAVEPLEEAIRIGAAEGAEFSTGVAQVSLVSLLAERGDRAAAAAVFIELIERWLRSGTWPQLWTTLRNATPLLVDGHERTALLIWLAADRDAQAPALDPNSLERQEADRGEVEAQLEPDGVAAVRQRAAMLPRARVTEAAMVALADLADG